VWRHQATPTYSVQRYAARREVVSYERRRRVFLGKKCSPCAGVTYQGNYFEFIPTVSLESQHSTGGTGVPTCHDFPRFVIVSEKSEIVDFDHAKMEVFWEKDPLRANFHKCFPEHTETRLMWKFREIWPTASRWNRALFNGQKNKISARAPAAASARIVPKICQGQLQTIYPEFPKFHPNPFTSGGVIAERVNIVQSRHSVCNTRRSLSFFAK